MLDFDLAQMYEVKTGSLNQSVKRNIERFPSDFMFQLNADEWEEWKSQIVISKSIESNVNPNLLSQNVTAKSLRGNKHSISRTPGGASQTIQSKTYWIYSA